MTKSVHGLVISGCLSLSGCATYEMTYESDGPALDPAASYAIVHYETGRANLSEVICKRLAARGIEATIVATPPASAPSQFIVRYESSWFWDIDWYIYMLSVAVYDSTDDRLRGAALAGKTSLSRKTIPNTVDLALTPVFGEVRPEVPAAQGNCETPIGAGERE